MLKGHVFDEQYFGNQIFALFINTFLNGKNGVSNNYKNGMNVTYNGSTVTIDSGSAIVQGRAVEEDTETSLEAGTDTAYCKLVIEIDLDKENTETECNQLAYKIVKSASAYPLLTQTNIVKNNSGIYQYELARFKTGASGITDFQDMRTFLDFDTIYDQITENYNAVLNELQEALNNVLDGSDYLLKSTGGTVEGLITANGGIAGNLTGNVIGNCSGSSGSCAGNSATATSATKLSTARNISLSGAVSGSASFDGSKDISISTTFTNIKILTGTMSVSGGSGVKNISYPSGFNNSNCIVLSAAVAHGTSVSNVLFDGSCSGRTTGTKLYGDRIELHTDAESAGPTGNLAYKVVIMKV